MVNNANASKFLLKLQKFIDGGDSGGRTGQVCSRHLSELAHLLGHCQLPRSHI